MQYTASSFPGEKNKGVNPWQVSAYVQDKMELEGMVVNAGLRYDGLFQNTYVTDMELHQKYPYV